MKKILDFNDYILEMIFENKKELYMVLSNRLELLLENINHPISEKLLNFNMDAIKTTEATVIDYDDERKGNFTYLIPNKIYDYAEKNDIVVNSDRFNYFLENYPIFWKISQRTSAGIGKVIRKLFPGQFETPKKVEGSTEKIRNYIQEFTDLVIAERDKLEQVFDRIKIVDGSDISKYYNEDRYDYSDGSSSLEDSCMKYDRCGKYMDFYENGSVKLVVLMSEDEDDKIIGRALLWDIVEIDGEDVDRKFMDRVYTTRDSNVIIFHDYAKQNGWLYKYRQNMYENEKIVDPTSNKIDNMKLKTTDDFEETEFYPYLDTLKYFNYKNGNLTNFYDDGYYHKLEDTEGGPVNKDPEVGIYVEYYDDVYQEDELEWCELGEEYRLLDDANYVDYYDKYATNNYIENNMIWSDAYNSYIEMDDAVFSEYLEDYIISDDSVEVYKSGASDGDIDDVIGDSDYIDYVLQYNAENDFIKYESINDGELYFHPDDENNFIKCKSLKHDGNKTLYAHKEWDKEYIFEWEGEKWINNGEDQGKYYNLTGKKK